ncbi:MAG TPA: histone deacetylase family protein [Nitrosospira sp.]|nr:histone deacetylase family protein [Nitrosospira sp.]
MTTAFISHPDCLLHGMGSFHPERPERLKAVEDELQARGVMERLAQHSAPLATFEQLTRVHSPEYVRFVNAAAGRASSSGLAYLDPDTAMNGHSLKAARRAAGAVILAADLVMSKEVENVFCNIRPPGHHAERDRAMGFCLFNNIAAGVAHAMETYGLERVGVVDFDVHHGNGTEDIFRGDPRVMMVSTFQHPFYPYSGVTGRSERMINIPLPAGSNGTVFREAVERYWIPALENFEPQMLFVSAGFDAHADDELASLNLVENDYAWVTERIMEIALQYADGRIVSALEGGYDLPALGRSVAAHLSVLSDG